MILKSPMEEKQLDFNQPLLSVRRFSSEVASENDNKRKTDKSSAKLPPLPSYKSELKSGPVSNPGTVPFVWEKTPGRPKNESKLQTQAVERPFITPKLPPGRVLKVEQQDFDKVPKGKSVTQSRTESTVSDPQSVASLDNKVTKHESQKNVSGLSEWDDQEVQPSKSFSTDQQARDFMIGRFLPAAKAMASETPQVHYNSRKPHVKQEQPRQIRKAVTGAKSRPLDQKWQKVLPHYAQDIVGREESEDESDDDRSENYAPKVCGLFPWFCLLNPIPGLRMEDRILNSAVHGVQGKSTASHRRTAKVDARTANYGKRSLNSQSGFAKEKDFRGIPEKSKHEIEPHRRGCSRSPAYERTQLDSSCESPVVEKTLYVDSVHMVKSSSSCYSEMKGPTNNKVDDFETLRKDSSIDKNPSIDSSVEDSKHLGIVDEKAALQPKSSVPLDSCLLVSSGNLSDDMQMEMTNHSDKMYSEKQFLTKPGYQGSNLDHDLVAISSPEMVECKKIESESKVSSCKESSDGLIQNPVSSRNLKLASELEFDLKSQQATKLVDQECTHGSRENPSVLASSKGVGNRKIDSQNQLPVKLRHGETSDTSSLKLPLALPLPKAPSESWLKRTLPTVPSRNISSRSNLAANIHAPTQTPKDPKWEIIVKSSNVHRGHLRFAEELTPIPEA
ncbi:hypothetical protein SESBI_17821 [Sesbania bispinosa]|nr:hypothetical protein SESBI_17821 [Sesbania bispinosa]